MEAGRENGFSGAISCVSGIHAEPNRMQPLESARHMLPFCAQANRPESPFTGICVGIVETYNDFARELPEHSQSCPPRNDES